MHEGDKTTQPTDSLERIPQITKRLGWRLHLGVVLYTAVVLFVTMRWFPKFYWSIFAAGLVISAVIIRFWLFSRRLWFWAAILLMAVLQVGVVFATNEWANRYKGSFIFFLILFEFFVIDAVVRWISPELRLAKEMRRD